MSEAKLSLREYAKHRGISHTAVQKAIKTGRISVEIDAKNKIKINPEKADREWQENTRQRIDCEQAVKANSRVLKTLSASKTKPNSFSGIDASKKTRPTGYTIESDFESLDDPQQLNDAQRYAKARAQREHYEAEKSRLEYEEKMGLLINKKEIERLYFQAFRATRDLILAVPPRIMPVVFAEKELVSAIKLMRGELIETLEQIHQHLNKEFEEIHE